MNESQEWMKVDELLLHYAMKYFLIEIYLTLNASNCKIAIVLMSTIVSHTFSKIFFVVILCFMCFMILTEFFSVFTSMEKNNYTTNGSWIIVLSPIYILTAFLFGFRFYLVDIIAPKFLIVLLPTDEFIITQEFFFPWI